MAARLCVLCTGRRPSVSPGCCAAGARRSSAPVSRLGVPQRSRSSPPALRWCTPGLVLAAKEHVRPRQDCDGGRDGRNGAPSVAEGVLPDHDCPRWCCSRADHRGGGPAAGGCVVERAARRAAEGSGAQWAVGGWMSLLRRTRPRWRDRWAGPTQRRRTSSAPALRRLRTAAAATVAAPGGSDGVHRRRCHHQWGHSRRIRCGIGCQRCPGDGCRGRRGGLSSPPLCPQG